MLKMPTKQFLSNQIVCQCKMGQAVHFRQAFTSPMKILEYSSVSACSGSPRSSVAAVIVVFVTSTYSGAAYLHRQQPDLLLINVPVVCDIMNLVTDPGMQKAHATKAHIPLEIF